MNILGISAFAHESAACLLQNGVPLSLVEEERLNREKHTSRFPDNAIREALRTGGLDFSDIDVVTFFWRPWLEIWGNAAHFVKHFPASLQLLKATSGSADLSFAQRFFRQIRLKNILEDHGFRSSAAGVCYVEHHLCHAASAFFVSPFEEAAILTIDGRGESVTTLWSEGRGTEIKKIREHRVPHSLGHLYAAVTDYLGFKAFCDEWKVMALAAYGTDRFMGDFEDVICIEPDGTFRLNFDYFSFHEKGRDGWVSAKFIERFGPARIPDQAIEQRHQDIAFALQRKTEEAGLSMARGIHRATRLPSLCLAGGVVLNCLMNKVILEQGPFRDVFIQPVANDAGTSLGSALFYHHQVLKYPRTFIWKDVYLGPAYEEEVLREVLEKRRLSYQRVDDAAHAAVRFLTGGKIIAWFQGRMEAGPRALGNRSLLADPRRADIMDIINNRIKKREWFRPFAPAVTAEAARSFFRLKQESPYMILAADVLPEKRKLIPGVVHRDGTARVQTVHQENNPLFWRLLTEFGKATDVPVLLNTSFNENEPLVCTPDHAVDCFLRTEIDALFLGPFIVSRPGGI